MINYTNISLKEALENVSILKEVFNNNPDLHTKVTNSYKVTNMNKVDEILTLIKSSLGYFNINFSDHKNYIELNYLYLESFLKDCKNLQQIYDLFENSLEENFYTKLIDITLSKYKKLTSFKLTNDNKKEYDYLYNYIGTNSEIIKNRLLEYFNSLTIISDDILFNYFFNEYIYTLNTSNIYFDSNYKIIK